MQNRNNDDADEILIIAGSSADDESGKEKGEQSADYSSIVTECLPARNQREPGRIPAGKWVGL